MARRDDREYREYLSEEQRRQRGPQRGSRVGVERGCIARRMQPDFRHGLLTAAGTEIAEQPLISACSACAGDSTCHRFRGWQLLQPRPDRLERGAVAYADARSRDEAREQRHAVLWRRMVREKLFDRAR